MAYSYRVQRQNVYAFNDGEPVADVVTAVPWTDEPVYTELPAAIREALSNARGSIRDIQEDALEAVADEVDDMEVEISFLEGWLERVEEA